MTQHISVPEKCLDHEGAVTMRLAALRDMLLSVREFSSMDDRRPALSPVWLAARKGRIHVAAFNPYCMAFNSVTSPERTAAFDGPIPGDIVKAFLSETRSGPDHEVVVTFTDELGTIRYEGKGHNIERKWRTGSVMMPDASTIAPDKARAMATDPKPTHTIGLNLNFLAMCAKTQPTARLVMRGPLAPVEVLSLFSDTFYAVIMPLRLPVEEPI